MKKFVIAIEEKVVQEFEITADSAEKAMEFAKEQYEKGVFVLSPGEAQSRQMAIISPEDKESKWHEF